MAYLQHGFTETCVKQQNVEIFFTTTFQLRRQISRNFGMAETGASPVVYSTLSCWSLRATSVPISFEAISSAASIMDWWLSSLFTPKSPSVWKFRFHHAQRYVTVVCRITAGHRAKARARVS